MGVTGEDKGKVSFTLVQYLVSKEREMFLRNTIYIQTKCSLVTRPFVTDPHKACDIVFTVK